jgi:CHAT domain-containing protein
MRAELIVLSACETGLANSLGGNELAGLGQAVLYAGARAVVMSLWRVDDAATSALMAAFYSQLTAGADAATALAQGAAEVRARWPHVAFWGAFIFVGDSPADCFRKLGGV